MSNRLITLGLFGLIVIIFGSYFIIQRINFPGGEPVKGYFQGIIQDAGRNQWEKAIRKSDKLQKLWRQKRFLVLLNYSEADYQFFEDALHRIAAAVRTGDRYQTVSQAMVAAKLWENFLKLIPEP